jgi:hypothetical protein
LLNALVPRLDEVPRATSLADLQSAFSATATALGHDMLREDIPASALDARIAAARDARDAIKLRQRTKAHAALQKFWLNKKQSLHDQRGF